MASLSSELALAKRFHMLSRNYDNRPVIARRNTLPALVRFLGSSDREMRQYSLEALYMLAQHPENVDLLSDDRSLVKAVYQLYKDTVLDDPELHDVSSRLLDCLEPVLQGRDPRKLEAAAAQHNNNNNNGNNNNNNNNNKSGDGSGGGGGHAMHSNGGNGDDGGEEDADMFSMTRRAKAARVLRGIGSDAIRSVVLDIPALDARCEENLATMEDIFQTSRGVLSYSIFPENRQARLFMTCETAALQSVLVDAGFESMVVRDDVVGQDVFDAGARNARSYYDSSGAASQPSYLYSFAQSVYQTALVLSGSAGARDEGDADSLAARVRQQRQREEAGDSTMERLAKKISKWW